MSNELVAYKPPPPPIPKEALKKEELSLRERAWVWNDLIVGSAGAVTMMIGIAWISLPLTLTTIGLLMTIIGALTLVGSGFVFFDRVFSKKTAISSADANRYALGRLSHEDRAELCLMDRNRRARPHRGNFTYAPRLYSVWPTFIEFDATGKGLHLIMLEHVRPRPYLICYALPRRLRFSQRAWWVKIGKVRDEKTGTVFHGVTNLGAHPDEIEVEKKFEELERLALSLEEAPHAKVISEYQSEAIALGLRRQPPSMRSQAIQKTRKVLNK